MTTRLALVPAAEIVRRDKRGRRIGRNWWREFNVACWAAADQAWWLDREAVAIGYDTEMAEYQVANPRPTLRGFLEANAGMADRQIGAA